MCGDVFGLDFRGVFHARDDGAGSGRGVGEFFEVGVAVGGEDGVGRAGAGEEFFFFEDGRVLEAADGDVGAAGFDFEALVHHELVGFIFLVVGEQVGRGFPWRVGGGRGRGRGW